MDGGKYYDQSRLNLVWNFCIALIFLLIIISVVNLRVPGYPVIPNLMAIALASAVLIIMAITRKYKFVAAVAAIVSIAILGYSYYSIHNIVHITTILWAIICILYTFFALGIWWGASVLAGHFILISVYYATKLDYNLEQIGNFEEKRLTLDFTIEIAFIGVAITYLLMQFIKANKSAEKELKDANKVLTEQNKLILEQNEEKEVMLREIHHRVKNNLQVITSLLRLQANDIKDEVQSKAFEDAINRVKSMALIHEQMYGSEMLSKFELGEYLNSLANNILDTYNIDAEVRLNVVSNIKEVGDRGIVPVSLIFNELMSNSLKHAFRNQEKGEINVEFNPSDDDEHYDLTYSDNGSWEEEANESFGLELIEIMTEQLDGEYTRTSDESGTTYRFRLTKIN